MPDTGFYGGAGGPLYYRQYPIAALLGLELVPDLVLIRVLLEPRVGDGHIISLTENGTPQGRVLSPLLLILTMDNILWGICIRAVGYADKLVVMHTIFVNL